MQDEFSNSCCMKLCWRPGTLSQVVVDHWLNCALLNEIFVSCLSVLPLTPCIDLAMMISANCEECISSYCILWCMRVLPLWHTNVITSCTPVYCHYFLILELPVKLRVGLEEIGYLCTRSSRHFPATAPAGAVAGNWLSTRSVVNLARSQVYHTERQPYLFAARSPWCSSSCGFVSDSWSLSLIWYFHSSLI